MDNTAYYIFALVLLIVVFLLIRKIASCLIKMVIMAILVTGGAGYIGSHTCVELLNAGYEVVVVDNLYNASEKALERVEEITAILNGTTNYILTEMEEEGVSFEEALEDAQELGYAEKNPENDVEGMDPARKLAILSTHAYCIDVNWEQIERRGITNITVEDIKIAKAIDHHIKLIARSRYKHKRLFADVEPMLLPEDHILSRVEDAYNGIMIKGNMLDDITIFGKGAGANPTGSAVAADVIAAAVHKSAGVSRTTYHDYKTVKPESFSQQAQSYMIRTRKNVSLPLEGIISSLHVDDTVAYFTKPLKRQEMADLLEAIKNRGNEVLNYMVIAQENPVVVNH